VRDRACLSFPTPLAQPPRPFLVMGGGLGEAIFPAWETRGLYLPEASFKVEMAEALLA
jgi:hypothetical protein